MWQKLKEQLPAVILTAIVVVGASFWLLKTVNEMSIRQQKEINDLRAQTKADIQATAEDTRHQIADVNTLLKDAIQKRAADVFMT